jgi:purine catabolism regulator
MTAPRLLWNRHVLQFVDQRLGALLEHDRLRAAKLLPTLEALCAHHWRKAETARALNLDRRSLYPRLERLQRVLDADLDDRDTRLGLELALRVWRLLTPRPERADAAPTEPGLSLRLAQVYLGHGASPR